MSDDQREVGKDEPEYQRVYAQTLALAERWMDEPARRAVQVTVRAAVVPDLADVADQLPAGEPVVADEGNGPTVAWLVTEGDLDALWLRCVQDFPTTGLWPVVVEGLDEDSLDRPWRAGEFYDPVVGEPDEWVAAADKILGTSAQDRDSAEPGGAATVMVEVMDGISALVLVPAARPAEVPWRLGWAGSANYGLWASDVSAVLCSWEERFGAVVVQMGFDTLWLAVARPPSQQADVEQMVLEHYIFCPDNIDQGIDRDDYWRAVRARIWAFWWD
ncbi:MAG: DUF4253 domain-containing protein [Micrococcales bacterium]|nr:DUF4253 domain-containing protein [Micrococcales bacterium]MCL2666523.1 DUF4253 domain-containing protein [Micrococcales bacterium]